MQKQKPKINPKDISKLKEELNGNKEDLMEYDSEMNNNLQESIITKYICFLKRLIFYDNSNEQNNDNNKAENNNEKNKSRENGFCLKMDQSANKTNNEKTEEDLGTSYEIIDLDKNSVYTMQTGTNFDILIKKKKILSPYLILLLFGSATIIFLLYKSQKIRKILQNLIQGFKNILNICQEFCSSIGRQIGDFLEKYNDIYRFLGDFIMLITFWIIFKILLKCISNYRKNKQEMI